jgi:sugar/nucleoside kinase (ribokinase family)
VINKTDKGILCVGRVYCDLVFAGMPHMPRLGEEVYAESFSAHAGGGAYITAAYLAAAEQKAELCAYLPHGPMGTYVQQDLEQSGISGLYAQIADESWGTQLTVAMALNDDRAFLTRRGGAPIPDSFDRALTDSHIGHVHIAELATLLEAPFILEKAKAAGLTISLDCAWDEQAMDAGEVRNLIEQVDLFLPNLSEFRRVFDVTGEIEFFASELSNWHTKVVVKRGADGATLFHLGQHLSAPAQHCTIVDPTGAGDAFNAGFLTAWLAGKSDQDALAEGNRFAASSIGSIGGATGAKLIKMSAS